MSLANESGTYYEKMAAKIFETDVALASGIGGVSYAVQGIMTLMVALPINTPPHHKSQTAPIVATVTIDPTGHSQGDA